MVLSSADLPAPIAAPHLERGHLVDAHVLRTAITAAFKGSEAECAWTWKTAYDACEAAQVVFLRKFGPAASAFLAMLAKVGQLVSSHTRRSEDGQAL